MANVLKTGMAWLTGKMEAVAATAVTYRRGTRAVPWNATIGRQLLRIVDGRGQSQTTLTDRDFTGPADELADIMPPVSGDVIDIAFGDITKRFSVGPVGSEPCWRFSDEQGETSVRVHTKFIGLVGSSGD